MAAQRANNSVPNKRRGKKRQSRTEVSSSSESDSDSDVSSNKSQKSDVLSTKSRKSEEVAAKDASPAPILEPTAKKTKKKSTIDTPMTDAPPESTKKSKTVHSQPQEDFSAIYLRKIAAELADDLDKVREAQDFKANSVPMLIHALKQGESTFSAEEKRRVVGAAGR